MSARLSRRGVLGGLGRVGAFGGLGALGALGAFGGLATLSGCQWLPRQTVVPLARLEPPGPCTGGASTLLVMLPGAASPPSEFVTEGFVDLTRRQGAAVDIVVVDSHLGYFRERSIFNRLHDDVIAPARAQGYQRIWLVGISLGGFGALAYGARRGQDIDGIVALAPFLGPKPLLQQITAAGGPAAWRRTAVRPPPPDEGFHDLWQWLSAPPPGAPPFYLGFGSTDRLVEGHRLLAQVMPPDRVTEVPGGHDWPPWRALWQQWLARGLLPTDCRGPVV